MQKVNKTHYVIMLYGFKFVAGGVMLFGGLFPIVYVIENFAPDKEHYPPIAVAFVVISTVLAYFIWRSATKGIRNLKSEAAPDQDG
jgi:divalent metal cation (Fe/Co/Zn/Cd) transporter